LQPKKARNNEREKMKVEQFYNKNQFSIRDRENGFTYFQSYQSMVAKIDTRKEILTLGKHWDYSKTTMKHLYLWLGEKLYSMNTETRNAITNALQSNNTRKAIQKLIDEKIINYDEDL